MHRSFFRFEPNFFLKKCRRPRQNRALRREIDPVEKFENVANDDPKELFKMSSTPGGFCTIEGRRHFGTILALFFLEVKNETPTCLDFGLSVAQKNVIMGRLLIEPVWN